MSIFKPILQIKILTGFLVALVFARLFLGLMDIRWRAAELSNKGMYWAGLVKSTAAEGSSAGESWGTGERGLDEGCEKPPWGCKKRWVKTECLLYTATLKHQQQIAVIKNRKVLQHYDDLTCTSSSLPVPSKLNKLRWLFASGCCENQKEIDFTHNEELSPNIRLTLCHFEAFYSP